MVNLEYCSGCAACAQICPLHCIEMKYDIKGFLYPAIDKTKCIECGICNQACEKAHENNRHDFNIKSYIAYAMDDKTRNNSASGGVFTVLAKYALEKKGIIFGAVFDKNFHVVHKKSNTAKDITLYQGSKYVQSNTLNTYQEAKKCLENNDLVLYAGTPCQIAGLYGFLNGKKFDNLISVSLICHGVPSPGIWERYLDIQKANYNSAIKQISFREKNEQYRWGEYHLNIEFENGSYDCPWYEDLFFQGFEYDFFLRPSCTRCISKGKRQKGDIIIGDYWKALDDIKYAELNGVSSIIALTEKGNSIINNCKDKLKLIKCKYTDVCFKNETIEVPAISNGLDTVFWNKFIQNGNLLDSIKYTKEKFNELRLEIESVNEKEETTVVWGIGRIFDEYIDVLLKNREIKYLCESNEKLVGKTIKGILVISQDDLKKLKDPYVIIMVDKVEYVVQIIKQLNVLDIKRYDLWRTIIKLK